MAGGICENITSHDFKDNKTPINIVNTNARSLRPKIPSLVQCFLNLALTFAIITETWFASGIGLELESERLLLGHGLGIKCLNRPPVNGLSHGGVAIVYRESIAKASVYSFPNPDLFEVLPVIMSVVGVKRKFFVLAVYIPPGYTAPRGRQCMQHVNDLVLDIKNKHSDPYIVIAGDFNQWLMAEKLEEFCDLQEIPTPPTRGNRKIDKIFLNWSDDVDDAGCLPPLETELEGERKTYSDHKIQYVCSRLPNKEPIKWENFKYRPFTDKGGESFKADLEAVDWNEVLDCVGSNAKANKLQQIVDDLTNKNFPSKTITRKEDDLPWLNTKAKNMIKKKQAIYKAEGKSERWHSQLRKVENYLEQRRLSFLESQKTKFIGPQASANFFKNVKAFKNAEKPKMFDIRDMRPGVGDADIAEEVAEYFNRISREFKPLEPAQIPMTYHKTLPTLTEEEVTKMLRTAKKTKSKVEGDIFPSLINDCATALATPLMDIYNTIISTFIWPSLWKKEYVTTIPKKNIPENLSDLRNISCTLFFSKVFEGYVMKQLLEEIAMKPNQFGGVKGCSTTHMIVSIMQEICQNAEDYRSATIITAIDYAKAFNRVSYQHCLEALRKKGASTPTIRLIASFLTNRAMTVRVGEHWSNPLPVQGGCPQGSVLGVSLFNSTTDALEDDFVHAERTRLGLVSTPPMDTVPTPTMPSNDNPLTSTPEKPMQVSVPGISPITGGGFRWGDHQIEFRPNVVNAPTNTPVLIDPPRELPVGTQVLEEKPVLVFKYVDDNITCAKLNFGSVPITVKNGQKVKVKQALPSQNAFRSITTNAGKLGMVVNASKTGLLCVSDSLSYKPETFILDAENNRIECVPELKVLGFTFSSKPTVEAHVKSVVKRLRQRTWSLRHLGKVGFSTNDLVKVYQSTLLPIADYCAPAYHSMLTDEQDQQLEAAQTEALRAIYGYGRSARQLRQEANINTLRARRIEATDKFARKCLANPRFCGWFPKRQGRTSARSTEIYREEYAKCERLKNSPIFYMRRRLNGKEGKIYGERNRVYRENLNT